MIHPFIEGYMSKEAVGAYTEEREYERFNPEYYNIPVKNVDILKKYIKAFSEGAKRENMDAKLLTEEKEYTPRQLLKKLQDKLDVREIIQQDLFPHYYTLDYPKELVKQIKKDPEGFQWKGVHPLDDAIKLVQSDKE